MTKKEILAELENITEIGELKIFINKLSTEVNNTPEKKKARFTICKELFLEGYLKLKGEKYHFSPVDAGSLSKLIEKIIFTMNSKDVPVDDESVALNLKIYLNHASQSKWIGEHFQLKNLNSQYNEQIAKSGQGSLVAEFKKFWAKKCVGNS